MFKKKCSSCARKIERDYNYCPYCGDALKERKNKEDFGLLGVEDSPNLFEERGAFPPAIQKMVNSLMKQFENQMNGEENIQNRGLPKGFSIKISTGKPQVINQMIEEPKIKREIIRISEEEMKRRMNLPRVEAKSNVKRLGDKIIYEISAPGIKERKEVMITKLASGLEIKAYTSDKCYVKIIPLKVEIIAYQVRDEKVFIEIKA
jgi:hypothetical protein